MKAKSLLALTCAGALVLSMTVGCSKEPANAKDAVPKPAVSTEAPKKSRTDFVIGLNSDIVTLDPHQSTDVASNKAIDLIYNTLLAFDAQGNLVTELAESYAQTAPTNYVFKLKTGVTFHNGETLQASDVKFSLDRLAKSAKAKTYMENVTEVKVIDAQTVEVVLSKPHVPFLMNMAASQSSILSEKAVTEAEANGDKYGEKPIGTGCMTFTEWKINDSVTLTRFDGYFGGKKAASSIKFRVIPESGSRTIALETGEVDFLADIAAVDMERIKANPDLKSIDVPALGIIFAGYNCQSAPFDNVKVRRALTMSVDRSAIIAAVYEGKATAPNSFLADFSPVYDPSIDLVPYNVEQAKALLSEAGYPNGFATEISVSSDERNRIAQLMQADFSQIGVTLDIGMMEWGTFLEYTGGGKSPMFIFGYGTSMNSDSVFTTLFHSSKVGPGGNRFFYANPAVDALIEGARSESDDALRKAMYVDAQKLILTDAAVLPLAQTMSMVSMNKHVDGIVLYKNGAHDFSNAVVNE